MPSLLGARLKHAWNAFKRDPTESNYADYGQSYTYRPDRLKLARGPDKTIIASIYNRIAMDVAAVRIEHVLLDDEGRYVKTINSPLNKCLSVEANMDQTGRAFVQDAVLTMLDVGCVALVPTETDIDPTKKDSFDILSIRTATVQQWYPKHVKIDIYNEETGNHSQYTLPKSMMAIVENPFYPVMNEPNSTLQRLIRKLSLLDAIEEKAGSDNLNMIIQLPYVIRTDERRRQAENRRKDIEKQLTQSKYGIAYADGTEKIIQLNKPLENGILSTIEYLTSMLYSQLGITAAILDGTADEQTMLNYQNRVVEPILSVFTDEMIRKFLTKTARSRMHSLKFFRDPFRLVPISAMADIANSFTRNEVMTANEIRQEIGMKPSTDPTADELRNKNMPIQDQILDPSQFQNGEMEEEMMPTAEETSADLDAQLDELEALLNHSALKHYLPTPASYASKYYDPEKAHEYYMKNRELKGRDSLSGLNQEGKEVASYVKKQIYEERNKKLEGHSADVNKQYEDLRSKRQAAVKDYRQRAATRLANSQGVLNARSEAASATAENRRETLQKTTDREIEQSQAIMQRSVETLRRQLQGMSPEERSAKAGEIQKKIDKLRADNNATKEKIAGDYSKDSSKVSEREAKTKEEAEKKFDVDSKTAATIRKDSQAVINNNYYKSVAELMKSSKETKAKIKEEYTEKWLSELDRLKTIPEYLTAAKGGKGAKAKKEKEKKSSGGGGNFEFRKPIEYNNSRGSNSRLESINKHASNVRRKVKR